MTGRPRGPHSPLDVRCPQCNVPPGERCLNAARDGRRGPHAERAAAAKAATAASLPPRIPSYTSDAWTCPVCEKPYWPPLSWEPEVWRATLAAAQTVHGRRHAQERIDKADGLI